MVPALAMRWLSAALGAASLAAARQYFIGSFTRKPEDYGPLFKLLRRNVFDGPGVRAIVPWLAICLRAAAASSLLVMRSWAGRMALASISNSSLMQSRRGLLCL